MGEGVACVQTPPPPLRKNLRGGVGERSAHRLEKEGVATRSSR